jgi:hypothetical protein
MDLRETKKLKNSNGIKPSNYLGVTSICISLIALSFSVYEFVSNIRREEVSNRPIISIIDFDQSLHSTYNGVDIRSAVPGYSGSPRIIVKNFGKEPAYDFKLAMTIIEKSGDPKELHLVSRNDYSISNPIVNGVSLEIPLMPYNIKNYSSYFYKIVLYYKDISSDDKHMDSLYYSKSFLFSVPEGPKLDSLASADNREKAEIDKYLSRM